MKTTDSRENRKRARRWLPRLVGRWDDMQKLTVAACILWNALEDRERCARPTLGTRRATDSMRLPPGARDALAALLTDKGELYRVKRTSTAKGFRNLFLRWVDVFAHKLTESNALAQAGRANELRQTARRNPALPAANG